ncbi:MAG: 4-(cytidine 5'-diphospho)-2-C-methyl-D-erythritol kinase [Butyricicoccaceae bacterium]
MKQLTRNAYAKINLTLDVTGRLENGYHTVEMVMQSIGLHDEVTVTVGTGTGCIEVSSTNQTLPNDRSNLAYRAAELLLNEQQLDCDGIAIHITKNIPIAAGLAGGSTNAAAVLCALNELYGCQLSADRLAAMGAKLGADIPFCIYGGTMLARGIGEQLTRLNAAPQCHVVLCKPPVSVSTPAVYKAMDSAEIAERPDTAAVCAAITSGDYHAMAAGLCNVMQPVTGSWHPEVLEIRQTMLDCGADGAVMSGSGPSTFGLFSDPAAAQRAYERLKPQYTDTFLTNFAAVSD